MADNYEDMNAHFVHYVQDGDELYAGDQEWQSWQLSSDVAMDNFTVIAHYTCFHTVSVNVSLGEEGFFIRIICP